MSGKWWGVITETTVMSLAEAILNPDRANPIIVVTTPTYADPDHIPQVTLDEADGIRSEIGDISDIAIVATGDISYALEAVLPDRWHSFNGACRSYPAGILADPDIRRSPLRRRRGAEVYSEQVIGDAFGHAMAAGVLDERPTGSVAKSGTITGFLGDEQALVDVGRTFPAVVWRDMTSPGIPLEWLIEKGATVPGEWDRDHNRFVLRKPTFGSTELLARVPHGAVTLALVDSVAEDTATLRLHPDLPITVHRRDVTSNPLDVLDLFLLQGEVVRVRVVHLSTGKPHLRLSDVDDDEPVAAAVTVVDGGTPWLMEGRILSHVVEMPPVADSPDVVPLDEPVTPVGDAIKSSSPSTARRTPPPLPRATPGPGLRVAVPEELPTPAAPSEQTSVEGKGALNSMSIKITALTAEMERMRRESNVAELSRELEVVKRTLRDTRLDLSSSLEELARSKELHRKAVDELRVARKGQRPTAAPDRPRQRRGHWPNDDLWLRHEILLAWVERMSRVDKLEFPLPADFGIGPGFAESVATLDDTLFDKAMKCAVDVLTGRAKNLASRELHRLRVSESGGDAPKVRDEDGAVAWRAAVEINAPSARRLHYWAIGELIELSQVGTHDDMEI